MIGQCPWEKELKKMIVGKDIIYTGSLKRENIPTCLSEADTFLLCRKKDAFSQYGFPIKLGEYLAMGQPVLVSDLPEFHDYLTDKYSCIFFNPMDEKALAEKIIWRYQNRDKSKTIGQQGRVVAKKEFRAAHVADKMAKSILQLIAQD